MTRSWSFRAQALERHPVPQPRHQPERGAGAVPGLRIGGGDRGRGLLLAAQPPGEGQHPLALDRLGLEEELVVIGEDGDHGAGGDAVARRAARLDGEAHRGGGDRPRQAGPEAEPEGQGDDEDEDEDTTERQHARRGDRPCRDATFAGSAARAHAASAPVRRGDEIGGIGEHRQHRSLEPDGALERPGRAQQAGLGEGRRHELKPQGQAGRIEAAGHRDRRQAGEAGRRGEDVGASHRDRVAQPLAEPEGAARSGRADQDVRALEGGLELAGEERPQRLGPAVVALGVAGGEGEGPEQDAARHLVAEARAAGRLERPRRALPERARARRPGGAKAEAHAVEAGQVGARLGGGDDRVGGERRSDRRHRHLDDLGARRRQGFERGVEGGPHPGGQPFGGLARRALQLPDRADPPSRDAVVEPLERRPKVVDPPLGTGGVARIGSGEDGERPAGVLDGAGDRTDLVHRGGVSHQAPARDPTPGRPEADDAAERRGLADRAAGVRAQRQGHAGGGDRHRRAAGRAARDPRQVPRVAGRAPP